MYREGEREREEETEREAEKRERERGFSFAFPSFGTQSLIAFTQAPKLCLFIWKVNLFMLFQMQERYSP